VVEPIKCELPWVHVLDALPAISFSFKRSCDTMDFEEILSVADPQLPDEKRSRPTSPRGTGQPPGKSPNEALTKQGPGQ